MTTKLVGILKDADIEYRENTALAPYTSFKIGGNCPLAIFPKNENELKTVLDAIRERDLKYIIIGNGTNLLISDNGFSGAAVVLNGMKEFTVTGEASKPGDRLRITAQSGCSLTSLAKAAAKRSLSGLEFAYGIPGTVGGGVYMNAGAYGGEMANVTVSSSWYDMKTGELGSFEGEAQDFGYRHSAYMSSDKIILSATLELTVGDKDAIEAAMNDYMQRRRDKQPLELPSAGSVFKRGNGFITAMLIEQAGLKGRQIGGARVSDKHAGFIVNTGGAKASEVLALIEVVKGEILEKFGKSIECEIRCIGD